MLAKIKYLTAGESHGKGLLGIIDNIPAGLDISEDYIAEQLFRRQQGHGRGGRMKIETDRAEIYTGVRHGKTLGSPIGLILPNKDFKNWTTKMSSHPVEEKIKKITLPRPGHADLAGVQKFDFDDVRNVLERSSARETAMRVALASVWTVHAHGHLKLRFTVTILATSLFGILVGKTFSPKIGPGPFIELNVLQALFIMGSIAACRASGLVITRMDRRT